MKRIGFYGGSFDPPHAGHQATLFHALTTAQLDKLIVAPVYKHPYGKDLVDYDLRLDMCHMLIQPCLSLGIPIELSSVERLAWEDGGKGLTCNTINKLIQEYYLREGERPHVVVITGSDVKKDLPSWEGFDQLMELCVRGWCSFFFVDRIPGLSSTAVRNAIKNRGFVDRWVPRDIHDFIFQRGLYR